MTYLYIMSVPSGFQKVGVAENPVSRCVALQIGNPEQVIVTYSFDLGMDPADAHALEQEMHKMLSCFHVRGEWFDAPLQTVFHVLKISLARALEGHGVLPPGFMRRWERMCLRPAFAARYAESRARRTPDFSLPWDAKKPRYYALSVGAKEQDAEARMKGRNRQRRWREKNRDRSREINRAAKEKSKE